MSTIAYPIAFSLGEYTTPSTVVFTQLAGITMVTLPGFEVSSADSTTLDQAGRTKTCRPVWMDPGSISFECKFTDENFEFLHDHLLENMRAKIVHDGASVDETFSLLIEGFISKLPAEFGLGDDEVMIKGEFKCSGDATFDATP